MTLKKTRFAPSPNGKLHLGHAYSAIISEKLAKKYDGEFIVRIEDIDIGRCSKENEELILNDLKWLNIKFDEKKRDFKTKHTKKPKKKFYKKYKRKTK